MIERTEDRELILSILEHPDIWPTISGGVEPKKFQLPIDENYFYLITYDPEPTGLFIYHWLDDVLKTHHHVLPEFRGEKSIQYSLESADWAFENTACKAIVCSIPENYPNVIRHAKKGGLVDWYSYNGVHWLRLDRADWRRR